MFKGYPENGGGGGGGCTIVLLSLANDYFFAISLHNQFGFSSSTLALNLKTSVT